MGIGLDNYHEPFYVLNRCNSHCGLSYCRVERKRYIYGLLDKRNDDIFYVGSTFDLPRRFTQHLQNNPYVRAMLERGAFPIPILLCEFMTVCDAYSRQIERGIAYELRTMGYSAYGDDIVNTFTAGSHWFYEIAEEQAHYFSILCDMWGSPG